MGLAIVMVVEHTFLLIAVSKSPPSALLSWEPDSASAKSLAFQAGFFFVLTWYGDSISNPFFLFCIYVSIAIQQTRLFLYEKYLKKNESIFSFKFF